MSEDTHSDTAGEAPGPRKLRLFFMPLVLALIGFPIISLAVASWLARDRSHLLSLSSAQFDPVREGALEGALLPGIIVAFFIVAPLLCAHVYYLARTARKLRESRSALGKAGEAKESLAAFLDASSGGFHLLDSELNYLDSHPGPSEQTARLTRDEIVGRNMADVVPAIVESGRYEIYKNVIRTGKAVDIGEVQDASNRIISRLAFPVGTNRLGILATDVTERRIAQDALQSIVEGTSSTTGTEFFPAMVRHLASGLRLRYASVAETVGGDGTSANVLAIWMGDHVAGPLSRELLDTPFARVLNEGRCAIPTGLQKRFPKDPLLSDLHADSFVGVALKDADDGVLGYLCVLHDKPIGNVAHAENVISVFASRAAAEILRLQAATRLKEKQADLEEAQRVASVGNWSRDLATGTTSWSDEMYRIYGFPPQSVSSNWETASALMLPDEVDLARAHRANITNSGVKEINYWITRPDGVLRFLRGRRDVICDSEGKPVRVVGTIQDVTERRIAQDALQSIVEGTSSTTGTEFFPAMVRHLASGLRLRYASVAETVGGDGTSANVLAIWMGDHVAGPLSRELLDTPFARVLNEGRCAIPTGLQKRFPKDPLLSDLHADSFVGVALKDADDGVLGYLCVLHDKPIGNVAHAENVISVFASRAAAEILRLQAATRLKEKQADLEEAQRVASVGNWSRDLATGTTSWSDEMYRIYGFPPQSVSSNWETASALMLPDEVDLARAHRANISKSGVKEINYWITRQDGVARFLRARRDVICDSEGKPVRVVGTIQDITERKQAEAEREEYYARSIGVIQNSVDSIITIDDRGMIESVNPATLGLFGYEETELVGQNVSLLMPEPDRGNHDQCIEAYKTSGSKKILDTVRETQGVQKGGTTFPLRISVTEVRFGDRRIFAGIIHDLTRESELERQLLQAQKLESVGTLAGGIAHDFNNILHAILGFNTLAQENMEKDSELLTQCLMEIEAGSRRAADLVSQILTFSRTSEIDYTPMTLQPLIEEALRFLRSSIPATIQIDKRIDPDCGPVLGNATQIHQVVTNLCTNAMHAMEAKGGSLTVSLEPLSIISRLETLCGPFEPGESVQLSVADTGTGIEPDLIERLIDPFFTTKGVGKGTGLGLAMVHGIVKSMGGGLLIESELGSGTKVRVIFPLLRENQVLETPKEPPRPHGRGTGNVMIVDDEEVITKLTARMLESRGFTVDSFNDSGVALEALKVTPMAYNVALLDYTMPGKTGGDLAREFQTLAAEMPVILATGHIDELEHEQTSSPNIVDIIRKPFDIDALVSAINRSR